MRVSFKAVMSFVVVGILSVVIWGNAKAQIINGGFETGNFTGWTDYGFNGGAEPNPSPHQYSTFIASLTASATTPDSNAAETSQTNNFDGFGPLISSAISPFSGSYMAFISNQTANGNGTLQGSELYQTFTVPTGAQSVSFSTLFLSNETINSGWDFGGVALLNGSNVLDQFNLDHQSTTSLGANVNATATPMGGFNDSTPWVSTSFSLAGLSGQSLTLDAYVLNTGDDSVESRLLLDNVQINGAGPAVPEPGDLAMLCGMAFSALGFAFKRRLAV